MTKEQREKALKEVKNLEEIRNNLSENLKEVNNQIYNIQKELGYYAKNQILYGGY